MIGFSKLQEMTDGKYEYHVAKSVKGNHFYVVDMEQAAANLAVAFTFKTKTDVANRSKKIWFSTLTAMRGDKGGAVIRDLGDASASAKTVAAILNEFISQRNARAIVLRVRKMGSGRMWDNQLKVHLRTFKLTTESTKIAQVGTDEQQDNDYSYFVVLRPGTTLDYVSSALNEDIATINQIAAMASKEAEPARVAAIKISTKNLTAYKNKSPEAIERWVEDNPPVVVQTPEKEVAFDGLEVSPADTVAINRYRKELERSVSAYVGNKPNEETQQACREYANACLGVIDSMPITQEEAAKRLQPYLNRLNNTAINNGVAKHYDTLIEKITGECLKAIQVTYQRQYRESTKNLEYPADVQRAIKKYTGAFYESVNLDLASGTNKKEDVIESIDSAFGLVGINASQLKPFQYLYRGCVIPRDTVVSMLESGQFASLSYMSTSTDAKTAAMFTLDQNPLINPTEDLSEGIRAIKNGLSDVSVIFLIETENVPVLVPGVYSEYVPECEVLVNRGTVFAADLVNVDAEGRLAVIKLKIVNDSYVESITNIANDKSEIDTVRPMADILRNTPKDPERRYINDKLTKFVG